MFRAALLRLRRLQNLFGPDGVLVQKVERGKEPAGFYPSKRVDFSLYID